MESKTPKTIASYTNASWTSVQDASCFYTQNEIAYYQHLVKQLIKQHGARALHSLSANKEHKHILQFLDALYSCLIGYKLKTRVFWLLHDWHSWSHCQRDGCSKEVHKDAYDLERYPIFCSRGCASGDLSTRKKIEQTCLDRHGVKCSLQSENAWNAIHEAIRVKYGGESGNIWETDFGKSQCRKTRLEKNDGKWESEQASQQRKQSIIRDYGGTSGNIWGTEHGKQAIKATSLKNCGYEHPMQAPAQRARQSEHMQRPEVQAKRNQVMSENQTFNKSLPEEETYEMLCKKFGEEDIERQHWCERYPFSCDFYIKSLDLFIECNYSWTHGGHFFDCNSKEDLAKAQKMKEGTKYYQNAWKTWTQRDLEKARVAQQNQLHYLVFWNLKEAKQWIEKL